ncbi:hypothetical protein LTR97_011195 [Elasticomyces elasticus]|uniref:IBR domain-containing protein n=1 Tax=Elasticomyces elasticus TaxID=574655 RepID=A0AAN7ZL71_9PEZI|nr:hypothetical protein LTR97_011195 [Elasticomyces elasticus]
MSQHADGRALIRRDRHDSFVQEVLQLRLDETEDGLDEYTRQKAQELGVEMIILTESMPRPTKALSSDTSRRSQESVGSRASQSTGFMSTFSDASREHQNHPSRAPYRASLSFRDYDAFVGDRGRPNDRNNSISFSPPSTPSQSALSLALSSPSSSPKRHFRRIRGLSMLRLGRNNSNTSLADGCAHCPRDTRSQHRAIHKLPCGHKLCTQALRCNIKAANSDPAGAVPSCCSVPIPGNVVEQVIKDAEHDALQYKVEHGYVAVPTMMSAGQSTQVPIALDTQQATHRSEQQNFGGARNDHELTQLGQDQAEQLERLLVWAVKQKAELETQQTLLREQIKTINESSLEALEDANILAMAEAEDKQVQAEADMRNYHDREIKDNATALKHMEAYCAGTYSNGEPHNRPVTAQDLAELEKTKRSRESMDARHDNAINVLRGEQSRRIRLRAQRQERELQELRRVQRKEELEQERLFTQEIADLEREVGERRTRLQKRWQLETAIATKQRATSSVIPTLESMEGSTALYVAAS